ncbi:MAG: hypothetical protein QGG24_03080 [Vicinamibacterales bacterium]|jgi:hypothetical protein|nr:hypothetical protein [Acidobacteriota bacterium]MDP7294284.1 hypothetical protein [Vicinamibacterales bacterium]MDP7471324.1 hypothetical protein [Vicinamibacterales bacterium]|tara:strand:+ start:1194 stop:1388 length:195 start_codon:yes stop_codon:yes gene_type:complete
MFPDNLGWGEVGAYGSVRGVGTPRTLSLEPSTRLASPPSLVVEATLGGVLGDPSSSNRTAYTKG